MINQSTIDKLIEMRLTSMADAFRIQMDDLAMKEVPLRIVSECWWMLNTPTEKTTV